MYQNPKRAKKQSYRCADKLCTVIQFIYFGAISSERFIILETLIPGAGSNSFKVTTGPWLIFLILPSTPKSKRIFSKKSWSTPFSFESLCRSFFIGDFKKSREGSLNFTLKFFLSFSLSSNGKSSWIGLILLVVRFSISFETSSL